MQQIDVLIVGAGPVGLMLACELQKRSVSYRILEARASRDYFCKALGVTPRTLEVFDLMGILDEALDRGLWLTGLTTAVGNEVVAEESTGSADLPYGFFTLAQYETEKILESHLDAHGGFVEYGTTVTSAAQDDDGVTATLASGETLRARWLVACDGSHSTVRKAFDIPFEGSGYPMIFLLGDVDVHWDKPRPHTQAYKLLLQDGENRNLMAVIPIAGNPNRYRISMAAPYEYWGEGAQLPESPDLELLRRTSAPIFPAGVTIDNLRWSSMYRISHRIVPKYRWGRVFLAGDAAHIHPPIGGQGMNTGLQDAFNLGWKLAMVAKGQATDALLDTYDTERHAVGVQVVQATAKRMDAAVANDQSDVKKDHAHDESQLYIEYRASAMSVDAGEGGPVRAGDRAPYVRGLRRERIERDARLIDLLRGSSFHLIISGADDADRVLALADVARTHLGDDVRCAYIAARQGEIDLREQVPMWTDASGEFRRAFGTGAWLVRPDGHLAWTGNVDGASLEAYLQRWVPAAIEAATAPAR